VKLYIVGSVASGKSTLARKISKITCIPCHHLDEVVYTPDFTASWGNKKRTIEERDVLFESILASSDYIMEDTGRDYFMEGMRQADTVILLEIPLIVRQKRILFRWIKQNIGIEKCIYKPRFNTLKLMFKWAKDYDTGADGTKMRAAQFQAKTIVLHNNREIIKYLNSLKHEVI